MICIFRLASLSATNVSTVVPPGGHQDALQRLKHRANKNRIRSLLWWAAVTWTGHREGGGSSIFLCSCLSTWPLSSLHSSTRPSPITPRLDMLGAFCQQPHPAPTPLPWQPQQKKKKRTKKKQKQNPKLSSPSSRLWSHKTKTVWREDSCLRPSAQRSGF